MANHSFKVKDLLKLKKGPLVKIGPRETVHMAIQKLIENNIGALPVCDTKGVLLGIISERDLLKECAQYHRTIGNIKVEDAMTKDVATGIPEDDLDYVRSIMIQKEIRHLPIMVGPKLEGIISMRDVVAVQLEKATEDVHWLKAYIHGGLV